MHTYHNHLDQAKLQPERDPKKFNLEINKTRIFDFSYEDFKILEYDLTLQFHSVYDLSLIAAVSENGFIGKDGSYLGKFLKIKRFRKLRAIVVIMGKYFLSIENSTIYKYCCLNNIEISRWLQSS